VRDVRILSVLPAARLAPDDPHRPLLAMIRTRFGYGLIEPCGLHAHARVEQVIPPG
jgi:hypothetical protein